jgi:hypothetical protein
LTSELLNAFKQHTKKHTVPNTGEITRERRKLDKKLQPLRFSANSCRVIKIGGRAEEFEICSKHGEMRNGTRLYVEELGRKAPLGY